MPPINVSLAMLFFIPPLKQNPQYQREFRESEFAELF